MPTLIEQRQAVLAKAKALAESTPPERFTTTVKAEMDGLLAEADRLEADIKTARVDEGRLARIAKLGGSAGGHGRGSRWAAEVIERMDKTAAGMGVKALLTGEVETPPAVGVSELPDIPLTLLDLIPRNPQTEAENYFSYLRQTVRTNNAAPVADNATKPTSVYTFTEIEDRCRVVAHLSEPFPLRYLSDHTSMTQVLDQQMRRGVFEELEQQIVSGDGTGENFTGVLNVSGVQVQPFTTDVLTTIRKARTAMETVGELPNAWVFNPVDAEQFDLMREDGATGGFLLDAGSLETVFGPGIARVSSLAVPAGTALLADWSTLLLKIRENAHTLAATQAGDLFDKNQVKLRAEGRFGLQVGRPRAIIEVDLAA